ncbi:hypothetical protein [Aquella oligotrophica]|uniref:Response regulatory domain-containing protein n=1 Tax=Aquella oligotrophica TaxID=2067065 RepID=A0A2I7N4F6_9NEIS|nr:hypothetical protein [Aquella oligotrophica]AUR51344.1 hypothetical protein CUN60_03195 [Aquella oligotrophica]
MEIVRVLLVDDQRELASEYKEAAEMFCDENQLDCQLMVTQEVDVDSAIKRLSDLNEVFDIAIIDLTLSRGADRDTNNGNKVIEILQKHTRLPIIVATSTPGEIDSNYTQSCFLKVITKDQFGNNNTHIIETIFKIYNTGITKILNKKGKIEECLNNLFWSHFSRVFESWIDCKYEQSPEEKESSLLRSVFFHINEYIDQSVKIYNPNEFYIYPPVKKYLSSGDIVSHSNFLFIVMTPACSIEPREQGQINAEHIVFAGIDLLSKFVDVSSLNSKTGSNNKNRTKLENFLKNKKQEYYFLPKFHTIEASLINFEKIYHLSTESVNKLLENGRLVRVATISAPFIKDIIEKYSAYYSRQGAPDFDTGKLYMQLTSH